MSNSIKILSQYTLAALALIPLYAEAKLADTPFVLDNQAVTTGGSGNVKPNVIFLIDDSGSMNNSPNGKSGASKLNITKNVLNQVLTQYTDTVNWSLQTLNRNGGSGVSLDGYTTNHNDMMRRVNGITADGGTPTTRRYYEVSQFIRDSTQYRCQKNYILLVSDGDSNLSCLTSQWRHLNSPTLGNLNDPYFGSRNAGSCVYLSTGSYDTLWDRNDGLGFFSKKLAVNDFKTSGNDAAGKSWNGDPADPQETVNGITRSKFASQTAETFTIGFGNALTNAGRTYLQEGASRPNYYFSTENGADLLAQIRSIFDGISSESANTTGSSYGTTTPAVTRSSGAPGSAAVVYLDTASWSSQLRFFKLKADGSPDTAVAFKQPSFNNRQTLVNTGNGTYFAEELVKQPNLVNNEYFNTISPNAADQNEWRDALLPWTVRRLNGNITNDTVIKDLAANRKYSQAYRERAADTRDLGDIIDGSVRAIGDRSRGNRDEFLAAAANDGMVHLFRSNPDANATHPYDLLLSYMPAAMERSDGRGTPTTLAKTLKDLAHPDYGQSSDRPHRYMVNGGFTLLRTPTNENSQIFMFGAMGQGGRGAYALNVGGKNRATGNDVALSAGSSTWKTGVPLFETPKGSENTLGYTVGTPKIGRISIQRTAGQPVDITQNIRYAGFLASGFPENKPTSSSNQETALYVYDMLGQEAAAGGKAVSDSQPGKLLGKITAPEGSGGLATPTLLDTNFDGVYDLAYAGDYAGNMFRFDLRGTPDTWSAVKIFSGKGGQPITTAPTISRRINGVYVVIFGTGSEIYSEDLNSTESQALYGIYDDTSTTGATATADQLLTQNFTERDGYYYLSNQVLDPTVHKGWTINLTAGTGERVVVQPSMLLRTALFTTRMYSVTESEQNSGGADPCVASTYSKTTSAKSRSLAINSTNGGGLTNKDARLIYDSHPTLVDGFYPSGKLFEGLLSQVLVYPESTNNKEDRANNPLTSDGQGGGSGTDQSLNKNPAPPRNTCFNNGYQPYLQTGLSGNTTTPVGSMATAGPACSNSVRRINWREIF